jgi:hypothetical protein
MTYTGLPIAILAEKAMYSAMIPSANKTAQPTTSTATNTEVQPSTLTFPTAFWIAL